MTNIKSVIKWGAAMALALVAVLAFQGAWAHPGTMEEHNPTFYDLDGQQVGSLGECSPRDGGTVCRDINCDYPGTHVLLGAQECVHDCPEDMVQRGQFCFCSEPGEWDIPAGGACVQMYLCGEESGPVEFEDFRHAGHREGIAGCAPASGEILGEFKRFVATLTLNAPSGQSFGAPSPQNNEPAEVVLTYDARPPFAGAGSSSSSDTDYAKYAVPALAGVGLGAYWIFGKPEWLTNSGFLDEEGNFSHNTRVSWKNTFLSATAQEEAYAIEAGANWEYTFFQTRLNNDGFSGLTYGAKVQGSEFSVTMNDFDKSTFRYRDPSSALDVEFEFNATDSGVNLGKTWEF